MTNHVHLLAEPETPDSLLRMLQSLGRRCVRYVNQAHGRTGTLWEGRYRAAPIDAEAYFLSCCRYIELNPVRAGMVKHPLDYKWSSYAAHAHGAADRLVGGHALFQALGPSEVKRRAAYRALFRRALGAEVLQSIRKATNSGWALGEERFQRRISAALGYRVGPLPRGRPRKAQPQKIDSDPNISPDSSRVYHPRARPVVVVGGEAEVVQA